MKFVFGTCKYPAAIPIRWKSFSATMMQGVILIVINGDRPGADNYEVSTAIKGGFDDLIKIPFFLMTLAQKFAADIKQHITRPERTN